MAQAFFGGVHPHDMKAATNEKAIEKLPAPALEAYINDHKKQRSLLLARSTLEYSNQLLHEYSSEEAVSYTHLCLFLIGATIVFPAFFGYQI